jgi:hypothetical protein
MAPAAVLFQETFESYSVGNLNGNGGWSGDNAVQVASGGLSYTSLGLIVPGGSQHAEWSAIASNGLISNTFAGQNGNEVWFSFTMNVTATDNSSRFFIGAGSQTDNNHSGGIGDATTGSAALNAYYRNNSQTPVSAAAAQIYGTTRFVVGRISKDGPASASDFDRIEIWLDPFDRNLSLSTFRLAESASFSMGVDAGGIDTFMMATIGTASSVKVDNIVVGTTLGDVLKPYFSPIPEPATATLLLTGSLMLRYIRRSRLISRKP